MEGEIESVDKKRCEIEKEELKTKSELEQLREQRQSTMESKKECKKEISISESNLNILNLEIESLNKNRDALNENSIQKEVELYEAYQIELNKSNHILQVENKKDKLN